MCLVAGFFQNSPPVPFLFAGFALYPFAAINHSHEYACVQSPVHPHNETSNMEVASGVLDTEEQLLAEIKDSLSQMLTKLDV